MCGQVVHVQLERETGCGIERGLSCAPVTTTGVLETDCYRVGRLPGELGLQRLQRVGRGMGYRDNWSQMRHNNCLSPGSLTDGTICGVGLVPELISEAMELGDDVFDGDVRQGRRGEGFWVERRH